MFGLEKARSGRAGGGGRAGPRTTKTQFWELREALADAWKPVAGPVASQIQGFPVFRLYSAFSTSLHPIPLPALQNAAGGPFWAVLAVLRGLDVYAEGMSNGFVSFSG